MTKGLARHRGWCNGLTLRAWPMLKITNESIGLGENGGGRLPHGCPTEAAMPVDVSQIRARPSSRHSTIDATMIRAPEIPPACGPRSGRAPSQEARHAYIVRDNTWVLE